MRRTAIVGANGLIVAVVLLRLAPWDGRGSRLGRGRARLPHPQESEQVIQLCRRVKAADHSAVIGVLNLLTGRLISGYGPNLAAGVAP
jgi:hypothetical protein